ncbi:MAG: hypothetical protein Q9P14_04035 [candidate division KSB1 bacterium]|nr:hypothetical protein [candidate division KSB1 bacterium]MDQ7062946.1 hypothetical protein [candidate division KSB1 bacterium]
MAIRRIVFGLAGLLGLCVYAYWTPPIPKLADLLNRPEPYINQPIELYVETTVERIQPEGFWLRQRGARMFVRGDAGEATPGDFVTVTGVLLPDTTVAMQAMYIGKGRRLKMAVSAVGALLALVVMVRSMRLTRNGVELKPDA